MNARPIVLGSAVIALLAIIPAVHAQSIRKPSPVLRDGNLGPNQIVEDRSKKPFAAPNTRLRPLAFGSGCQPSITKTYSRTAAGATTEKFPGMAYFESPISVATAAGAKVRRIVVHEWTERWWGERYAWSEAVIWNISASIEFENAEERGCLMTDGVHVSLRDATGGIWLFRPLPAAQ